MIILRAYRVMVSPRKRMRLVNPIMIKKWPNEYDFGFNIYKPVNWLIFLKEYKKENGNLLTRNTSENEEVAYEVYVWGTPLWMKEYYNKIGINDGHVNLFPGYLHGEKKGIAIYGVLQRSIPVRNHKGNLVIETIWENPIK